MTDSASKTANFTEVWDTDWYLKFAFTNPDTPFNRYMLRHFHEVYKNIIPNDRQDKRCLDYGGGPTIYSLISASPRAKELVSADYTPSNQEAVKLWKEKDPKGFDWRPFIEYVVKNLEGKCDGQEVTQREEDIRSKVTLVPCDLKADDILALPPDMTLHGPPYDVIGSCFTVEIVVENESEYIIAVQKLSNMLKPGGHLILSGWSERMSCEAVKDAVGGLPGMEDVDKVEFGLGQVSVDFVKECMGKAGLEVVYAQGSEAEDADEGGPERYHFVVGRAPK
ncbi:nicotinamide N-methyltransferase [Nematostella vectensis]|uniref:nicotinamide N-methyltransferase n=1 Tax=Nematostella vectensis TaxID=45351 RepID=UPI002076F50E|nr:nicotinamide N-methyltransferase [Nematostella vectensis]